MVLVEMGQKRGVFMKIRKGDILVSRFPPSEEMRITKLISSHDLVELERLCKIDGHEWADFIVLPCSFVKENYYVKLR